MPWAGPDGSMPTRAQLARANAQWRITSRCETGMDEDAERWRLSFDHGDRACRFVVDEAGTVLKRATFSIKTRLQDPSQDNSDTRMKTSATASE
jgi:hypothetical protein